MTKRSILVIAVFMAALIALAPGANAQGGTFIGSRNVTDRADHDTIVIGAARGTFKRLQFRVEANPVDFRRVVVHFVNGGDEELELRERIPAGGQSRWIDLRGNDRKIRSIEFWYDSGSLGRGGRSRVNVFGAN